MLLVVCRSCYIIRFTERVTERTEPKAPQGQFLTIIKGSRERV